MRNRIIILIVILCAVIAVVVVSCSKNSNENKSTAPTTSVANTTPAVTEGPEPTTEGPRADINFIHNANAKCDWTGDFIRNKSYGQEKVSLNIAMADSSSFQFQLDSKESGIGGFATIDGNLAKYNEESGNYVEFMYMDDFVYVNRVMLNGEKDTEKLFSGKFTLVDN